MGARLSSLVIIFLLIACQQHQKKEIKSTQESIPFWEAYDETEDLQKSKTLEQERMHLKLINSRVRDKNKIWEVLNAQMVDFNANRYQELKPVVLDKSIPELQESIQQGKLTYTDLVKFYLYRIRKFESDNKLSLNAIISLNEDVIVQANRLDQSDKSNIDKHSVYGMPILLKDNIDAKGMVTTAGAVVLQNNQVDKDAYITQKLKSQKALVLGKANLSEWAYFLCAGCPVGYSAIGGQTMNPYGRLVFESGGSSSGSGAAVAANFCVAAIGTETSGSILSPSSQNSLVGLKPTIGTLSRSGIVPISSTLDTPGPMTRTVMDNAIVYKAMLGKDVDDPASQQIVYDSFYEKLSNATLAGKRFGVVKEFLEDSLYSRAVSKIKASGGLVFEIEPKQLPLSDFITLLSADMKMDLKNYLKTKDEQQVAVFSVTDIRQFNLQDSLQRIPYGQQLFDGITEDSTSISQLKSIKKELERVGRLYFDAFFDTYQLDAVLSINNYHAGYAAVAKYPALTVPMGYSAKGEPKGLTFIGQPFKEDLLLSSAKAFEEVTKYRVMPEDYR
ncbi:amidase family protein [Aquimarina brevivitae]|uniref:Amidase n=1 Tax=Aquimarina brevivitae TaxID=323412 RepID=A0A4Q7PIA0_9FLAO|nr:amidase family protein [Aquimarina brevivitae]RZT00297.1 amidase [Aquimarina brevivitae]